MTDPKGTAISHDYNLLTNNEKTVNKANLTLLEQAKSDLLGTLNTLDFESTLVNRCILAKNIADNRFNRGYEGKGIPFGTIDLRGEEPKMPVDLTEALNNKYPKLKKDYEDLIKNKPNGFELELKKLDTMLAERIILDNFGSIEFKDGDEFLDKKSAKDESQKSFENLNTMNEYEGKIELISRKQGEINYYVIKWTDKQLKQIEKRYEELLASEEANQKNEELKKKNEDLQRQYQEILEKSKDNEKKDEAAQKLEQENEELKRQIAELKKLKTDEKKENDEAETLKKQNEELKKQIVELKKPKTDEKKENDEAETLKKQNEELKKQIAELKKLKTDEGKNKDDEKRGNKKEIKEETVEETPSDEDKSEKDNNDLNKTVEEQRKRIEHLESLLKGYESKSNKEKDEDDTDKDIEHLEENLLYISRKSVEKSILKIRRESGYPSGVIEIRGERIHVEEFEFYEELKAEYIEAKGDEKRLSELDKEFAELAILCSPRGVAIEHRYQIRLTEEEIVAGGLVVSQDRLARYGLAVDFFEYTNTLIEREYLERLESIQQIETEITDLTTSITELSRKINIEGHCDEKTLLEIKEKKEKQKELREKLRVLILSLASLGNNGIDKLLRKENDLLKELDKLNKNKSKLDLNIQKLNDEIQKMVEDREGVLRDEFDEKLQSEKGITFNGHTYRYEYRQEPSINHDRKFKINWRVDGKIVRSETTNTNLLPSSDYNGKTDGKRIRKQWETLRQQYIEENIKSFKLNDDDFKKKNADLKKLKADQKKLNKEIADKEKELADVRKQIEEKESKNRKRVVVESFDDGDKGVYFHDYCEKNGIKRKDGKEISLTRGMDPNAIYVDKDGRELRLEWIKGGANDDGYDNPVAHYELVYYEETQSTGADAIIGQIISIMNEQDVLQKQKEELEIKLQNEKSENIKITIEEQIKEIDEKILKIKQTVTDITDHTKKYKETITQHKYRVYKATLLPVIPQTKGLELNAVISDMGTDVFREKAALKVEEKIKQEYNSLKRWQMTSKLALFLGRGIHRKRMMRTEMNGMANTAFQTNTGYAALNDQSQNAADRHAHELLTGMAAVQRVGNAHNAQIDQLCKDYLNGIVNDTQFQQDFNTFVTNDTNIQTILSGNNITHIGTNILLQLKEQRALNVLINTLDSQLNSYIGSSNPTYLHNMQNYVEQYIKDYQKIPAFKATFEQFVKGDLNARNQLKNYLSHQKAIMKMQIANLTMNIDIVNKGKSAYQIDNKDREAGWKYKLGHFLDKYPIGTLIGSSALAVGLGLVTGGMSAFAGAAVTTGVFGSYVGFTNYIKKWTHYSKEQNTHEKNVVTDYTNEQAKIQKWQNTAFNGHGFKKYKAKRQLALYHQTTQENIQFTNQIAGFITDLSAKTGPLTAGEENFMKLNLIEGWARLQYYKQMGHNFLASEKVDETEKDMRKLEKAISLGLDKIGQNTNDIQNTMSATNSGGANVTYAKIQNELKTSYDKSLLQFKRERRWLALRYGIGTAAISIGLGTLAQRLTHSGMFAGKDIPATAEIPGTPQSTTSYSSGTDNFALGKYDLPGTVSYADSGNIYGTTKSVLSNPSIPDGSHAVIKYGVGTDITPVKAGHLTSSELQAQLDTVRDNINAMSWGGRTAQRDSFLAELGRLRSSGFTNDNLATMRAAEDLEHYAQGWADSGKNVIIDGFNRVLDHSGTTYDSRAERFMKGAIDIIIPGTPGTPGDPGKKAVRRGRWFMGLPLFFNTFKERNAQKDTTDQKFGK